MRTDQRTFRTRASVLAVQGAILAMVLATSASGAESDEVLALTQPANSVTVGVGNVDKNSYKFGEYNGLEKKGAFFIGGIDLRGGGAYDSAGTTRWRLFGADIGLDTRSLAAEYGQQGKFRLSLSYDGMVRNQYDDYKTFYGGVGSTTLTAAGGLNAANHFAQIGGISTTSSSAANVTTVTNATIANLLANPNNIQAPNLNPGTLAAPNTVAATGAGAANAGLGWLIPASMQTYKIGTERQRTGAGVELKITDAWSFKASIASEQKDGLKLTGVGSISTGQGVTVPEPVQYTTSLFNASLSHVGANSHLDLGYSGSIFKNDVNTWTADSIWGNNGVQGNVNRMIGAPDNEYHQFKATFGYNFSKTTKLVMYAAQATATQNEAFIASGPNWYVPASSADAKAINTTFLAKLTARPMNNLDLSGTYRHEDRDNRTPYYQFVSTGRDAVGTVGTTSPCGPGALPATAAIRVSGLTCYDTLPINIRNEQVTLEGNYRVAKGQSLRFGYEWQKIKRDSDKQDQDPFRAHETKEQTVRLQYRNTGGENLVMRLGYEYSERRHSEFEIEPPLGGVLAAAVEPILPNLINSIIAARNRDRVRGGLEFQASETTSLAATLDYNNDKYTDVNTFGKKAAKSWVLNLEASFAPTDKSSLTAFYTFEDMKSSTNSLSVLRANPAAINPLAANCRPYPSTSGYTATGGAINFGSPSDWYTDPCRIWSAEQVDKVDTFGLAFRAQASKFFDLDGSLTYSRARTPINMSGMQVINNGLAIGAFGTNAAVNNNIFIPVASMPESTSKLWDLSIGGRYLIDKSSAVRVVYNYRKLTSYDAQWDAYAANPVAIQGYVGLGIGSANYKVNVLSAMYIYNFR